MPQTGLTNKELAERFNVSQEWILEKTGIAFGYTKNS